MNGSVHKRTCARVHAQGIRLVRARTVRAPGAQQAPDPPALPAIIEPVVQHNYPDWQGMGGGVGSCVRKSPRPYASHCAATRALPKDGKLLTPPPPTPSAPHLMLIEVVLHQCHGQAL
jgi:hypothetical protein